MLEAAGPGYKLQISLPQEIGSRSASYFDPEIHQERGMMAWSDGTDNTLWVCHLDRLSGDLIPRDGRGARVAKMAPFMGDWIKQNVFGFGDRGTLNGAEWGNSREGLAVFFTIKDDAGIYQQAKYQVATRKVTQLTFGGDEDRFGNIASQDRSDATTRVGYFQLKGPNLDLAPIPAYWQNDEPGAPQYPIPLDTFSSNGPRWIPGRHAIVTYVRAPDDTIQVVEFNVDTGEKTFLTSGPEEHLDAQVILDPETSEQKYLICLETKKALALYEWDGAVWVKLQTFVPPDLSLEDSPEYRVTGPRPFIVNGRLFFLYYVYSGFGPVKIYIASGDGAINQRLVNENPLYQIDPEVFRGSRPNEVFVYFYSTVPIKPLFRFGQLFRIKIDVFEE